MILKRLSLLHEEKSKKEIFLDATEENSGRNFSGWYLCFHKHRSRNLNAYLNIYPRESIFLLKGNSAIQFNYCNYDSEKFKWFRENGRFDNIPGFCWQ